MPVERAAGIIVFRNTPAGRRYLVIRSRRGASEIAKGKFLKEFWDFPKGLLEKGETGIDAARREAGEEAGFENLRIAPEFKKTARYFTRRGGKPVLKFAAMFLGEAETEETRLSWEHDKYEWLGYESARERISLPQMRKILDEAERFLSK